MRRSVLTNAVIGLLTVAVVIGAFASFQRKRSSFERIDFQFDRNNNGVIVVKSVDPHSGAEAAGLRAGDQIWLIAETPTTEIQGLQKTLRRFGQTVPMIVARGNATLTLTYRVPELKIDYSYLILSFIGFLYLAIGLFTLFRRGATESRIFYFVTLLSFIVYVYTPAGDIDWSYKLLQLVEEIATIILPPLALHFFLLFPRPVLRDKRTLALLYIPAVLLALWNCDLLLFHNALHIAAPERSFDFIQRWELLDFGIYFTLALFALGYTYRRAAPTGKKQIKWIYFGVALGFLPFLATYIIPFLISGSVNKVYSTISIIPLAFIPLAFALSILKYKLWDVEVVIKETLAYAVTFVFGMIAFSTINLLLSHVIEEGAAMERNFLAFTSGLLIAGVLIPVKGRVESVLERVLYRDSYRHRRAMTDFAQELATFHDVHELIAMIRERLRAALDIEKMNLFTREGSSLLIYQPEDGVPRRAFEAEFGDLRATPLNLTEPRLPDASEVPWQLLRAGYRYVFPLRNRGELQGLLLLGTKRGEEPLSRDDLHLLESLTVPVALAIENSRLYGRLRRQLEEIRALKEYNENIIESSSSAIAVIASDGTVLTANHAFWDLIGDEDARDAPIDQLFPPYSELLRSNTRSIATQFVNRLGVEKEVTVTSSALNASDVAEGTRVLVIGDVTDRVRLERELQDKERLASLGLLAAGVAHEVNTPLTGISSYAQLLLNDVSPDDPKYKLLKKMEQQSFRASTLVNNLLDLIASRPRTRDLVSIGQLVDATVSLHEDLFKAKAITIHLPPVPDAAVLGNFHDLQQVLTNVLLNARDAVPERGNIWINVTETGERIVITIKDDGKGIAPDLIGRIFEPLVTTKRGQGGTGLGLAITRRILHASDGEISVESAPGAGAEFKIELSRANVMAAPAGQKVK
jgi:signal transduction histidine kinase